MEEGFDIHLQELRRGTVVLACLQLLRRPEYGYRLLEALDSRGFTTDANTLYPLLRRLERQSFLTSTWNTAESRPRKFYQTSAAGRRLAAALHSDWRSLTDAITSLDGQGEAEPATPDHTDADADATAARPDHAVITPERS